MSSTTPFPAPAPTISAEGSPNILGPKLSIPYLGQRPEAPRPWWFIAALCLGELGVFVVLMGPATVSIAFKVQALTSDPAQQTAMLGTIMPFGALAALIFNALGGRISDRTTSGYGRRRPWLVIGILGIAASMLILALGTSTWVLALGWFLAQGFGNFALAALVASVSDQLPETQYGKTSGLIGVAQNVAVMLATWMSAWFMHSMFLLFMVPAVLGLVLVLVYALTIPEPVLKENRYPFNFREFITSFWTNPIRFPDFGLAWWGRFLIIFASMLFVTFRPMYMTRHLGLSGDEGAYAIAIGVTIYTVTVMIAGIAAGWISDLLRRRKAIVALSSVLFAIATYLLAHADTVGHFYMIEALMGIAIGMYFAVDMALVLEVLPDRLNSGKDLGVFNIANALPQSLSPAVGAWLLGTLGHDTDFTPLLVVAAVSALVGAAITMLIRSVR